MAKRESKAELEQREEQEHFKESNWKIANALSIQWDDLLDAFQELADHAGLENERAMRIGQWDWLKRLERSESGMDYLKPSDVDLCREDWRLCHQGDLVMPDECQTTLNTEQMSMMRDWHAASSEERAISFGIYSWVRVSGGAADEEECIFLFGLAYRLLGYLDHPATHSQEDSAKTPNFSALGKAGAAKRHGKMASLRVWTIEQYRAGKWPSANQAAHALKSMVIDHGKTIGASLIPDNAQRTIAEWIRKSV